MSTTPEATNHPYASPDVPRDAGQARDHTSPMAPSPSSTDITADMHAEIAAAMAELAAHTDAPRPAIRGPRVVEAGREHRKGTVVSVGPTDIFIEFGPKELGFAPRLAWKDDELPKVGEPLEVVVDRYDRNERVFICSRPGAVQKAEWELLEPGQVVEARVTGVNKGGLELEVAGHQAFMPAGQVAFERIEDLSVFVGEKLTCEVERVDRRGKGNIVLSRRKVLAEERKKQADKLKESLAEGQVLEGTVRKIMPFGAFVDLGGVDGLVHISDMTHDRVAYGEKAVGRYVKEGQRVRVQVLKLDWEGGRISLGMKQLMDDPFRTAASDIAEGAEVTGKVTSTTDYGAFVQIADGVEGLVHISELAWRRVQTVEEVVKKDEVVRCKVLKIDPDSRRISLSIKALQDPPAQKTRKAKEDRGPSVEEIMKESPALRRLKEKFGKQPFKGGLG